MMEAGRFLEAMEVLERSSRLDPHFNTLELLGECSMALEQWREAVLPLAAATTLNRGVRAPSLLAEVFLRLEEWSRAEEMADRALERDPNNGRARRVRKEVGRRKIDGT